MKAHQRTTRKTALGQRPFCAKVQSKCLPRIRGSYQHMTWREAMSGNTRQTRTWSSLSWRLPVPISLGNGLNTVSESIRFQTPNSVILSALTEFRGENSVSSSQPTVSPSSSQNSHLPQNSVRLSELSFPKQRPFPHHMPLEVWGGVCMLESGTICPFGVFPPSLN